MGSIASYPIDINRMSEEDRENLIRMTGDLFKFALADTTMSQDPRALMNWVRFTQHGVDLNAMVNDPNCYLVYGRDN